MKRLLSIILILVCITPVLSLMALPAHAASSDVTYKITTKICNGFQNGTNSKVNFTFYGTNGTYTITNVGDKMKGDSFERNKTDTYTFSASDIGQIYGLNVACGSDGVKFEYIKIEKTDSSANHLTTTFSINEWVDKTNKNFYSNRENVYRIKVVTGDNPTDGSTDKAELVLKDTAGKSATVKLNANKFSSSETELVVTLSEKLGTLSTATLKKTSYDYDEPDDWRPLYVQVERMSSSTTAENIKWEAENLFIFDQEIIKDPVTVSRYNGTFKNDKASGLASIFFEPDFYVIISIVLVMVGAGVVVYIKNKKQSVKKEDAQ